MTTRGRAARRFRRSCKLCVRLLKRGKSPGAREQLAGSKDGTLGTCGVRGPAVS